MSADELRAVAEELGDVELDAQDALRAAADEIDQAASDQAASDRAALDEANERANANFDEALMWRARAEADRAALDRVRVVASAGMVVARALGQDDRALADIVIVIDTVLHDERDGGVHE